MRVGRVLAPPIGPAVRSRRSSLLALGVGASAFTALQLLGLRQQQHAAIRPAALLIGSVLAYATLALPPLALSAERSRRTALIPPAVYIFLPPLLGLLGGDLREPNTHPPGTTSLEPLGQGQLLTGLTYLAIVSMTVMLASPSPQSKTRDPTRSWPGQVWPRLLGYGFVVGIAAIGVAAYRVVTGLPLPIEEPTTALVAGSLLADRKPWWPWFHLVYAVLLSGLAAALLPFPIGWSSLLASSLLWKAALMATILLIAAQVRRLAGWIEVMRGHPTGLLLTVNALNAVDALVTWYALRTRHSLELNPVVRASGLVPKLILVGVASYLVWRVRPDWLVVAVLALTLVVAYHGAGFLFGG